MATLSLQLLGPPRFERDGASIRMPRRKVLALLAYLAVTGEPRDRDALAELLYPGLGRERSGADFRHTLSFLLRAIGEGWLEIDRGGVALPDRRGLAVDVRRFRTLAAGDEPALTEAARLYRGDLLSGFFLRDSPAFEDWQLFERETLRKRYASVLERLVRLQEGSGRPEAAVEYARSALALDPIDEAAHRLLMRLYCGTGQRAAALRQYEVCRAVLAKELGEQPDERTEALREAIQRRRAAGGGPAPAREPRPAAAREPSPRPATLPAGPAALVGREKELAEVLDLIGRGDGRVLTLTGPGGTGKTALAVKAAEDLAGRFPDGVFFVDLSALEEPAQVVPAIAATLDVRESRGQAVPLFDLLAATLGRRKVLLVLDNFEHVAEAAGRVAALAAACPGLEALVTSRESLHIRDAREYPVPPLRVPDPAASRSADHLAGYAAVRLLVERAVTARPDFTLTDSNAAAVEEICAGLDGLPLAIELAASRLRVLSPQDLASRLSDRLRLLGAGPPDLPARQRTLRGAIEWSYDLLDGSEKRLFARLAVFAGGFAPRAAEEVCGDAGGADVLEGLVSLAEKNLLRREEASGESRLRMLETIGEYARLRLRESGEAAAVADRHAAYYLRLAETGEAGLDGPEHAVWLARLEVENANLRAAVERFLAAGRGEDALRLAAALRWYWYRGGRFSEGRGILERSLEQPAAPSRAHARALDALGWIAFVQGDWTRARALYERSLAEARELSQRSVEASALAYLGVVERWLGERTAGTAHGKQAVAVAREVGDPVCLARALISAYATTGGRFEGRSPRAELEEAARISREAGFRWGEAHALNGLGDLLRETGDHRGARPVYEAALAGFREVEDPWMVAWTLEGLGSAALRGRDFRRAEANMKEALSLFSLLGDRASSVYMVGRLALAARGAGRDARAARLMAASSALGEAALGPEAARRGGAVTAAASARYRARFAAEWARGLTMTLDNAIAYALRGGAGGGARRPRPAAGPPRAR